MDDVVLQKLVKKLELLERQLKELQKKHELLQDAFYRMHEEQRRRDRKS